MSVVIRGIDKPRDCDYCHFQTDSYCHVLLSYINVEHGVDTRCPIIEINEYTMKNGHKVVVVDTPQTDCDKCIWSVCNYNKVDWDADTPQTDYLVNTMQESRNSHEVDTPQTVADSPLRINERFKAHCLNCAECGSYKCTKCDGEMYYKADAPQTDCETCKYGQDKHRYAHICNECGVGINNYTPQPDYEIAKAIIHKAIDNTTIAEDVYPDLRQRLHDAVENAPQKELTAKCLNCHNAKACKEKHWDGCIYEPQTDCDDIYPLVIIEDRYTGVYSNGEYTAWNMYFDEIPQDIDGDDVSCYDFWHSYNGIVGLGKTPNEAIEDLRKKLNAERNEDDK